jgi:glutaconate CoA-transferase subunit A
VVKGGAHPSYTHGYYARDNATYLEWDKISADRELFAAWMETNVLKATPDVFAERVRGL